MHYSLEDILRLQSNLDCKEYENLLENDNREKFRTLFCIRCGEPLLECEYRHCYGCRKGFN